MEQSAREANANQVRELVASYFQQDDDVESETFFGYSKQAAWVGESGVSVFRPAYVIFAPTVVFFSIPFAMYEDIEDLGEELGPWGIGRMGSAVTYHLTFTNEQVVNNPDSTFELVGVVLQAAADRDYELTGEIAYTVVEENQTAQKSGHVEQNKGEASIRGEPADKKYSTHLSSPDISEIKCRVCENEYQYVSDRYKFCLRQTCEILFLSPPDHEDSQTYLCSAEIYQSEVDSFIRQLEKIFIAKITADASYFELDIDLEGYFEEVEDERLVKVDFGVIESVASWPLYEAFAYSRLAEMDPDAVSSGRRQVVDLFEEALKSRSLDSLGDEIVSEMYDLDFSSHMKSTESWLREVFQGFEVDGRHIAISCRHLN